MNDSSPPRRALRRGAASGLLLVTVALLAAGCGGSAAPGVANVGTNATTTTVSAGTAGDSGSPATLQADQLRYAQCMQSNGEPDYPEPGGGPQASIDALKKLDPSSPKFQSAQKACRGLLPTGESASPAERAKVENEALKFAHCMQTHGMPDWPDPSKQGYMVAPVGAVAHAPAYLKAAKICRPLLPTG